MAIAANVISILAQPSSVSYLCFEIGGILDTRHAELGEPVKRLAFQKLCDYVKPTNTVAGDPSRLLGDSDGILQFVGGYALATLRNEDRKAALNSAVNTRQNLYFSKYANAAQVISTIRAYYSRTSPTSKPNRLETLREIAQQQAMDLQDAYTEDDRVGVVRATSSSVDSNTRSISCSERGGRFIQESVGPAVKAGTMVPLRLPASWDWTRYDAFRFKAASGTNMALTIGNNYEVSDSDGTASGTQSTTHVDYEYRTPFLEARARNNRAQISLMDQQFEAYMFEQNVPHLEQIFKNELETVDNDVYRLQIAFLRSFLISPLRGIVTGVYKHPGDAVSPGEPVIRVEDNRVVHLVANVVHYGPIAVGATATVTTALGGGSSPATTLSGNVVSARGQASGGRWEVVVKVDNVDGAGNPILPIGYWFDAEYTQMTIL
jgi:hypothetical protein